MAGSDRSTTTSPSNPTARRQRCKGLHAVSGNPEITMTDDDYKYIYTKRRVYRLAKDAGGIPIEEVYPGAEMPEFLKGALVYETPRGRIIARQELDERGSQADGENARAEGRQGMGQDTAKERPRDAAERPEPAAKRETSVPDLQDNPMRFFRKDAPARRNGSKTRDRDGDFER